MTSQETVAGNGSRTAGDRVPVYAIWPEDVGPLLSTGMLTAAARAWRDGALNDRYEIRRPETAASFLADLATRSGPAVLLCSNYVWSLEHNLRAAAEGIRTNPDLVVVHGGPSTPKYHGDAVAFLERHQPVAHVLGRGEGERTLCELLDSFVAEDRFELRPDLLEHVQGITFLRDGEAVRTEDRERVADLDTLPSPYLTGEFDGIPPDAWQYCLSLETNRGCPYGCTFCDWGSSTMSRIRKFSLDRVIGEFRWAAELGVRTVTITDANFGIMSRDVEISRAFAEIRREVGAPHSVSWTAAKNTTKHLVQIMDVMGEAGLAVSTSLSLQTTDPSTLEVIARSNIDTDHYVRLAAQYRMRGYPLVGDLMLGLPGQTFDSYRDDLQFMLDHEVMVRTWPVQMLPNAPMNAPEYREEHALEVGPDSLIRSSATFSRDDRKRMWRFRTVDTIAERFGVLRHVMRYLQWDHGIPAVMVEEHLLDLMDEQPTRFPRLTWLFAYFDLHPTAPSGWRAVYEDVRTMLAEDFGVDPEDSGLRTVLELQHQLMPAPGRTFPDSRELPHDYLSYYRSAALSLYTTGHAGTPDRPLVEYPPATFTVAGDPMGLCSDGLHPEGDPRSEVMQGDFHVGAAAAYELDSPLMRMLPGLSYHGVEVIPDWVPQEAIDAAEDLHAPDEEDLLVRAARVSLRARK